MGTQKKTKKVAKRGRGRPPLPPGERREAWFKIRVLPAELREIRKRAKASGQTLTDYAVSKMLDEKPAVSPTQVSK